MSRIDQDAETWNFHYYSYFEIMTLAYVEELLATEIIVIQTNFANDECLL